MKTEMSNFAADAKLGRPVRMWSARRIMPGLYESGWQKTSRIQHTQIPEIHAVKKRDEGFKIL